MMFNLAGKQRHERLAKKKAWQCPVLVECVRDRCTNSNTIRESINWYFLLEGQFDNIYCLNICSSF
jgi:hypothetical protein